MRNISERELSIFISLLSGKIMSIKRELREMEALEDGDLSAEQIDDQVEMQESIDQYENMLDGLREEYEAGLVDGINLPSYEELTTARAP
ncbi:MULTISPECIES: hypothetical protein [unclassified Massilia]|uniref:hypothetical protein n=1 Tax=unclassified Massilia TaxID=2609279 RepID=UPI00178647D3|nr:MULTISPECIES: hypothetical protein [unclassified Massilia]MBD8531279.1 hypothetical protein [Massilia sp. CFBP 13647]MBD8675916.1 hypothetical protein [Massilia sp. CFBP 13721]